jgi:hypothetical protein
MRYSIVIQAIAFMQKLKIVSGYRFGRNTRGLFKDTFRISPRRVEENYDKFHSGWLVVSTRCEPANFECMYVYTLVATSARLEDYAVILRGYILLEPNVCLHVHRLLLNVVTLHTGTSF